MFISGLRLAAVFGFYPNKLGFCGPQQPLHKKVLFDWLCGKKVSEQKIRKILQGFEGAFPYYQLIARSNNISDPFAQKIVKAYWLGNGLLEKVPLADLKKMVVEEFSKRGLLTREVAQKKASKIPFGSIPHHSFHILFIGSITGRVVLSGKLLDLCRVGWGRVINLKSQISNLRNKIVIDYRPLQERRKRYFMGKPIEKIVFWDKKFIPTLKIGDTVAIHWNYVVAVLSERDLYLLEKYTKITLNSLNKTKVQ